MKASQVSVNHLITDLKAVARDSEELLKASASDVSAATGEIRNRLSQSLVSARATCQRLQDATVAQAKKADAQVHAHPYTAAGIAAGLGIIAGVMVGRRWSNGKS